MFNDAGCEPAAEHSVSTRAAIQIMKQTVRFLKAYPTVASVNSNIPYRRIQVTEIFR